MRRFGTVPLLVLLVSFGGARSAQAGSLQPPGPPGPTMKTLVDVEPRTTLRNGIAPLVISLPGSYYLAEDILAFPNADGIVITANHVTLDLNGFSVVGNLEVGSFNGIVADPAFGALEGTVIRNGTVRNFLGTGIYFPLSKYTLIEDMFVLDNGLDGSGDGIHADTARIKDTIVAGHPGSGIRGTFLVVTGSIGSDNLNGITGGTSVMAECLAWDNTNDGFQTSSNGVITSSAAVGNTGDGIQVTDSLVLGNAADGINAVNSTVLQNESN